ncbi:MAG: DUF1799 domain-containing protein [Rhizomicrobium sp.]
MRAAKVSEAEIAAIRAKAGKGKRRGTRIVVIDKDNVAAVRIFSRLGTKWRRDVLTSPKRLVFLHTGIDYGAAEIVARALKLELDEHTLDGLQVLEAEAKRLLGLETLRDLQRS